MEGVTGYACRGNREPHDNYLELCHKVSRIRADGGQAGWTEERNKCISSEKDACILIFQMFRVEKTHHILEPAMGAP